ncbi:MAG: PAAR domain-containing protein [Anaerolineaceae bacterium]|jgi:uncharacterized Zn-binding protein involved in type VI secretion|nr:PAAR domain-containing protein [Anaerolineaceae bacterium]
MGFPAARLGDQTATGDTITGPGIPTVLIGGLPASVMGDLVNGATCNGSITMGSPTVLIGGRPAARVTSSVTGVNPSTVPVPTPMNTTIAKGEPTVLIA